MVCPELGEGWGEGGALASRELVTNRYKIIIKEVRMKKEREREFSSSTE